MTSATPQRLYLMEVLRGQVAQDGHVVEMVAVCYLVTLTDGRHILIDSGMPADASLPPGLQSDFMDKNVLLQLSEIGLSPADINTVICTHFDIDHAGYHDAFPQAEFVVQRRHYDLAKGGEPRFARARSHWDHPDLRYKFVDGDVELYPGLKLIETSGHVPGHQSVLVHLPESGPILLAIDAVSMARFFTPERQAAPMDMDEAQLRASTQKLLDLVAQEGVALTVFGHDGVHWGGLKRAPDYYT